MSSCSRNGEARRSGDVPTAVPDWKADEFLAGAELRKFHNPRAGDGQGRAFSTG